MSHANLDKIDITGHRSDDVARELTRHEKRRFGNCPNVNILMDFCVCILSHLFGIECSSWHRRLDWRTSWAKWHYSPPYECADQRSPIFCVINLTVNPFCCGFCPNEQRQGQFERNMFNINYYFVFTTVTCSTHSTLFEFKIAIIPWSRWPVQTAGIRGWIWCKSSPSIVRGGCRPVFYASGSLTWRILLACLTVAGSEWVGD